MCIDPIVLPARADEPDVHDAIRIIYPNNDAIFVAGDIEYRATIVENARVANGPLDQAQPDSRNGMPERQSRSVFLEVLEDPTKLEDWRHYGGLLTLMSYGVTPTMNPTAEQQVELIDALKRAVPPEHLAFLQGLQTSFTCGDFFFVHAGVRPGVPLDKQGEQDLLWIRDEFLNSEDRFEKYIVHGHTPVNAPEIQPNRINIDTGAYATGNLTLLTIQGERLIAL